MVKKNDNHLMKFINSFFVQNTNGSIDWGLPSPHGKERQEGPVDITTAATASLIFLPKPVDGENCHAAPSALVVPLRAAETASTQFDPVGFALHAT